jgi:F0F1-type ATP synthase assembly protein I
MPMDPSRDSASSFLTMGLQLAGAVVAFFFLGYWLDTQWQTKPWLSIVGAVIGVAGGLTKFIRDAMQYGARDDREAKERRDDHRG